MRIPICIGVLIALVGSTVGDAQQESGWGGQIRPRYEFRDPVGNDSDTFTSMRVRAQMAASLESDIDVMVQIQDVRLWGEERNTLGDFNADNFDLHQGYVHLKKLGGARHSLKIGRQAVAFGGQRLIGAVEWTQQGRVFDGLRLGLMPSWGKVDVLAMQLAEATSAQFDDNAYLTGVYATLSGLDLYGLYNKVSGAADTDQFTLGARYVGKAAGSAFRVEGSFQAGTRGGQDVAAFMFGGRIGRPVGKVKLALWYDYLSGDDDPADGETKVFDTLFATNHKFYGFADLFLNIPVHSKGLGLQDIAVKGALPLNGRTSLAVHAHSFLSAQKGTLDSSHLGEEIDLTLTYKFRPGFTVVGGLSQVIADDGLKTLRGLSDDMTFAYLMTNTTF